MPRGGPGVVDLASHPGLELIAPCGNPVIGALSFQFQDENATDSGVAAITCDLGDGRRATLVMSVRIRDRSSQLRLARATMTEMEAVTTSSSPSLR